MSQQTAANHRQKLLRRQSIAVTQKPENSFDDDHHIVSRSILYPKLSFAVGLELPRTYSAYIVVKTSIRQKIFKIGQTETLSCLIDEFNNEVIFYSKYFEISYQVGVDERQCVIFEIMDGDSLQTGDGYLFASIKVPVSNLLRPKYRIPVCRGKECLGYLVVCAAIDLDPQVSSIAIERSEFFEPNYTSISALNIQDFFDTAVMGFFPYKAPTQLDVRRNNVEISQDVVNYIFTLRARNMCPYTEKEMGKGGYMFVKLCVNIPSTDEPGGGPANTKAKVMHHTHANLHTLWQSIQLGEYPYNLDVPELRLTREELTGSRKMDVPVKKTLHLIFQVYCYIEKGDSVAVPQLISYSKYRLADFLSNAHVNKKGDVSSTHSFKRVMDLFEKEKLDKVREEKVKRAEERSQKTIFQRISSKFSALEDAMAGDDSSDSGSIEAEIEEAVKGGLSEETIKGADDFEVDGHQVLFFEKNEVKGRLTVTLHPIQAHRIAITGGDVYEEELAKTHAQELKDWQAKMHIPFHAAVDEQIERTMRTLDLCDAMMKGWALRVTMVLDMHTPCTQHVMYKRKGLSTIERSYIGSEVVENCRQIFGIVSPFSKGNAVRAYAGGGVGPPPGESMGEDGSYDGGHWSKGQSRKTGFPLCHELLLDQSIGIGEDPDGPRDLLLALLSSSNPVMDWGGREYFKSKQYNTVSSLMDGAMEASTTYCPCFFKTVPGEAIEEPPEKDAPDVPDGASALSKGSRKSGDSSRTGAVSTFPEVVLKNRMMSAFVGTAVVDQGQEFWDLVPPGLMAPIPYDVDVEAIQSLLTEYSPDYLSAKFVIWIMGKCPLDENLDKVRQLFQNQFSAPPGSPALLVVLAAERCQNLDFSADQVVEDAANPFAKVLELYREIVGSEEDLLPKSSTLQIFHSVTFSEIMASSFLDEDKLPGSSKLDTQLPFRKTIYKVIHRKYKIAAQVTKRIIGLRDLTEEEEKQLEADLHLDQDGNPEEVVDDPAAAKDSDALDLLNPLNLDLNPLKVDLNPLKVKIPFKVKTLNFSDLGKMMGDVTGKKMKEVKKTNLSEDEELLNSRVKGFAQVMELKERFDKEMVLIMETGVRRYISSVMKSAVSVQSGQVGAIALPTPTGGIGCNSCITS